jgi:coxsackievirus/adenovirus receptor
VIGRQCDQCRARFFNLTSGTGCQDCKCNPLGSVSLECEQATGRCECQPGVTGDKCDTCLPNHYGFSDTGCVACGCSEQGSVSLQCNELGECECRTHITGKKCDMCAENFFNFTVGCKSCDECYGLVNKSVNSLRSKILALDAELDKSGDAAELRTKEGTKLDNELRNAQFRYIFIFLLNELKKNIISG